jgi:hypothetical protein
MASGAGAEATVKPSTAARFAWSVATVTLIFSLAGLALGLAHYPETPLYDFWFEGLVGPPVFVIVGALIVSRRPDNLIGWLFLSGVCGGLQMLLGSYATVALLQPSSGLGGAGPAAWLAQILQFQFVAAIVFLVLLFPTGSLISRAWRPIAWLLLLSLGLSVVAIGLEAGTLVVRFRASRGDERLQLKWLTYAGALVAICLVALIPPEIVVESSEAATDISNFVVTSSLATIPLAVGVAILRYRLYDIDRIINRTLVYGLLTAVLICGYVGCVLFLQTLLPLSDESPVAVAVSTLAMAALFGPLHRAIQRIVDRRFYRSRFDAARTVEEFSGRLRRETDLDALSDDLIGVVRETVKPAHASLWLRAERES